MDSSKILMLSFLLVMSLSLVSSDEGIRFNHQKDTNLTIYEKCRLDGSPCDNSFDCNITILSPDQELILDGVLMTPGGVYYSYDLNTTQTSINGPHETTVDCSNTTLSGSNTFYYQITPNGSEPVDEGQSIILLGGTLLLLVFSLVMIFLGIRSSNSVVMISLLSFGIILMVFGIGMIFNTIELSFGTFGEIVSNYSSLYILFISLVSAGVFALIVYLVVIALNLYWRNRGLSDASWPKK